MREYGHQAVVFQTALNPVVALELLARGERGAGPAWSGPRRSRRRRSSTCSPTTASRTEWSRATHASSASEQGRGRAPSSARTSPCEGRRRRGGCSTHRRTRLAPALQGTVDADVVVIGGGLTGLWTARALQERGASVVVLEAATCGAGASARNGGFLHGYWSSLQRLTDAVGADGALETARAADGVIRRRALARRGRLARGRRAALRLGVAGSRRARPDRAIALAAELGVPDEAVTVDPTERLRSPCVSHRRALPGRRDGAAGAPRARAAARRARLRADAGSSGSRRDSFARRGGVVRARRDRPRDERLGCALARGALPRRPPQCDRAHRTRARSRRTGRLGGRRGRVRRRAPS